MTPPPSSSADDELVRDLVLRAATGTLDALSVLTAERDDAGEIVDFRMRFTNDAAAEVTGILPADALGRGVSELFPQRAAWLVALWASAIRSGEPLIEEIELRRSGGPPLWIRQQIVPLGDAVAITSHDITARKVAEQELRHRATHDPLTDLPNRTLAEERIARVVARGETLVMFADLDHFKSVNDQLGHVAGDELLVQAARRLRSCLRNEDLVARFGGDEFLVCISDPATVDDATSVATKVLDAMRYPFHLAGRSVTTTVSIGVARGRAGDDPAQLIRQADAAAYRSKRTGRNTWSLYDETDRRIQRMEEAEDDSLSRALLDGTVQHRLVPSLRLSDGSVHSAVLRPSWPHPLLGVRDVVDYAASAPVPERIGGLDRTAALIDPGLLGDVIAGLPSGAFLRIPLYGGPPEAELLRALEHLLVRVGADPHRVSLDLDPVALTSSGGPVREVLLDLASTGIGVVLRGLGDPNRWEVDPLQINLRAVEITEAHEAAGAAPRHRDAVVAGVVATAGRLGVDTLVASVESAEVLASMTELGVTAAGGPVTPATTPWSDIVERHRQGRTGT